LASAPVLAATNPVPASVSAPSAYARELVARLSSPDWAAGSLPAEKLAQWKQGLQELIQEGAVAVPAIQEFLAKNSDIAFGPDNSGALGYSSARSALVGALAQIGGPEATTALLQTMQTTSEPAELAVLAQDLNKLAPDQFQDQAVQSARQLLAALSANSALLGDKDVAPLFEVLAKYGDAGVAPDLERVSGRWGYYAAIALAQLPDGAGIPSLVRLAQPPDGVPTTMQDPDIRALAELSCAYPPALDALVKLATQSKVLLVSWVGMVPLLAGDQLGFQYSAFDGTATPDNRSNLTTSHLSWGNQNFYTACSPTELTLDQVAQRLQVVQTLLSAAADPAAQQALANASSLLMAHVPPPSANPPGN
jgi:hypothetical protein